MNLKKLENEMFVVTPGVNKPNNKYFPNVDFKVLSNGKILCNNKYGISNSSTKDMRSFTTINISIIKSLNLNKMMHNIINNVLDEVGNDLTKAKSHHLTFSYTTDNDLIVFAFDNRSPNVNFNFPVQLNFDSNEIEELEKVYPFNAFSIKLSDETKFYFVSHRSYIFELMYKEYLGLIDGNCLSIKDFIFNLDPNKIYTDDFFKENKIIPRPLIYNNGLINIPIFEKIGENWIFYQHNFDKYRDKIMGQ